MSRPRTYPSDLTNSQLELIKPLLPAPARRGRREKHPRREIVDAILSTARSGQSWRQLPIDYPPWQTVYWYFSRWEKKGVTEQGLVTDHRSAIGGDVTWRVVGWRGLGRRLFFGWLL